MGSATTSVVVPGPRDEVFQLFADRENYRRLVGPVGARLVQAGVRARQGEGAIHRVGIGRLGVREQIVSLRPGRSFAYRMVTPAPVRHWIGTVEFRDVPGGTQVDYTLDVDAAVPVPGVVLGVVVRGMAAGLARGATRALRRAGA